MRAEIPSEGFIFKPQELGWGTVPNLREQSCSVTCRVNLPWNNLSPPSFPGQGSEQGNAPAFWNGRCLPKPLVHQICVVSKGLLDFEILWF